MTDSMNFDVDVHGKWILLGEHAVLRGCPALAFPVFGKSLELRWESAGPGAPFQAVFKGERGHEFRLLFSGVFDRALELIGRPQDPTLRHGTFEVQSSLPVGAGLGASAALSVAVGRWFVARGAVQERELFEFCREIENLFHGESSGVDVAVALENRGLHFERQSGLMRGFDMSWQPRWYISFSGARGITSECVSKVKSWIAEFPADGERVDAQMRDAVVLAEMALTQLASTDSERTERFESLRSAIELGAQCFADWGLSGGELGRHMDWLRTQGAAAVKPTGSGGGGFALSLWSERPAAEIENQLIPVFRDDHS